MNNVNGEPRYEGPLYPVSGGGEWGGAAAENIQLFESFNVFY